MQVILLKLLIDFFLRVWFVFSKFLKEIIDMLFLFCILRKHCELRDSRKGTFSGASLFDQKAVLGKTWGSIKSAGNTIKNTTQQAAALATLQVFMCSQQSRKNNKNV